MGEIAAILKDGLMEDGIEEAYRYMADVAELSDSEAEYFRLDMKQYRDAANRVGFRVLACAITPTGSIGAV